VVFFSVGKLKPETIQAIVDEMAKKGEGIKGNLSGNEQKKSNLADSVAEQNKEKRVKFISFALPPCDSLWNLGDAEWEATSKRKAIIYWRKPEEWASLISSWVRIPFVVTQYLVCYSG
jgi:hypothetical protein